VRILGRRGLRGDALPHEGLVNMKRDALGLSIPRVVKIGNSGRRWERFLLQVQRYPGCYQVEMAGCKPVLFYSPDEYNRFKQTEQAVKNLQDSLEKEQKQLVDSSAEVKEDKKDPE
jgi:hypothetical protein